MGEGRTRGKAGRQGRGYELSRALGSTLQEAAARVEPRGLLLGAGLFGVDPGGAGEGGAAELDVVLGLQLHLALLVEDLADVRGEAAGELGGDRAEDGVSAGADGGGAGGRGLAPPGPGGGIGRGVEGADGADPDQLVGALLLEEGDEFVLGEFREDLGSHS